MVVTELFAKLGIEVDEGVFSAAEKALGELKLGALAIGGALAATAGALYYLMGETRDYAIEATKAAQRTGMTVEAWQEMKAAGEASGVSAESLEHALILMSRAAYGASEGSDEMAQTFRKLGVSTKDATGKLKDPDALLGDLAEKFHNMPDGMAKTALATKAFGRSGAELIPFLNKGSEGIAELREHAHRLGLVLDSETIAAAKKWKQEMREMSERIEGLKLQVGAKLLKAFMSFKEKALPAITSFFETFAHHARSTMMIIGELIGVYALYNAAAIASAVRTAAAWVWASLPIVGLVALVGVLILAWEDFLVALDGGDSVIGSLGVKWTRFVDDLLKDRSDNWWVTKMIKAALRALMDLQGTAEHLFKGPVPVADPNFKPKEGEGVQTGGIGGWIRRAAGLEVPIPDLRTSAARAADEAQRTAGQGSVLAPNVSVTVNATTNAQPADIAGAVRAQIEDWHQSVLERTYVQAVP